MLVISRKDTDLVLSAKHYKKCSSISAKLYISGIKVAGKGPDKAKVQIRIFFCNYFQFEYVCMFEKQENKFQLGTHIGSLGGMSYCAYHQASGYFSSRILGSYNLWRVE